MKKNQRVKELEKRILKEASKKVLVYFHNNAIYTNKDGKEVTKKEIDNLSKNNNILPIIVTFE